MKKIFLTAFCCLFLTFLGAAQIALTGSSPYTQNFDEMTPTGTALPAGWSLIRFAGTGTSTPALMVTDGSANSGGVYNAGSSGAADRALGILASASNVPAFGAAFTNNTGAPINSLTLTAVHEQWRSGSSATTNETVVFEYSLDATALNTGSWIAVPAMDLNEIVTTSTAAAALDGNLAANRVALSATISSLNIANGSNFWIRWRDNDASGSDGLYAVDDFSLSVASTEDNTPPSIAALFPPHGTSAHPNNKKLKITFDENVVRGTGTIKMFTSSGFVVNVNAADDYYVLINGKEVTLDVNLFANETYKVLIPTGAFKDAANNSFAGLDSANWRFTTVFPDNAAPTLVNTSPANNALNVSVEPLISLTFSENVVGGTGSVLVKKKSDNAVAATIPAASLIFNSAVVSFGIPGLQPNTAYYVEVPGTLIKDPSDNLFAGFSGPGTLTFTTGAITSYSYTFNACSPFGTPGSGFTTYNTAGDSVWACSAFGFNGSNGVQINGFTNAVGAVNNEDWLISPALNLTGFTIPLLSFRERTRFAGPNLQVLVSTNYSGAGDPALATWVPLAAQLPAANSDTWTLVDNIDLSSYKTATTYIAFKYLSSPAAGAARTTLDDIAVRSSATPPPVSLVLASRLVSFDFAAAGSTSPSKSLRFTAYNASTELTLTAAAPFQVSKDNSTFAGSVVFTAAELAGERTVHIRFSPTAANSVFTGALSFNATGLSSAGVRLAGNSYPHNSTINVVNWNIEWFGSSSTGQGPADKNLQQANAKAIMDSLKADIYAVTEIVDTARLGSLTRSLNGNYSYVVSAYASGAPSPSSSNWASGQKLAFVYKKDLFQNITSRGLLAGSTTGSSNWATGRVPFLMKADVVNGGASATYHFILVHAKANTGTAAEQLDAYNRRKAGVKELKDTLDAQLATARIILLGDYNDDLDSTIAPGVSPRLTSYDDLIKDSTDADSYRALTLPLSLAGLRSTTSYEDMIDHVTVSNEVTADYIGASARVVTEVESIVTNYSSTTSDHYPILSRFLRPTVPPDVTAPTLVSTDPLHNATGVALAPTIKLTFSEKVQAGTGNILVKKVSDNSVAATIAAASSTIADALVSFPLTGLTAQTEYYIEVPAGAYKDMAGNGFAGFTGSGTLKFTTTAVTAIRVVDPAAVTFTISPNPATHRITFSFLAKAGEVQYQILNAGGSIVFQSGVKNVPASRLVETLSIQNLSPGAYFLQVLNNGRHITQKFIKK